MTVAETVPLSLYPCAFRSATVVGRRGWGEAVRTGWLFAAAAGELRGVVAAGGVRGVVVAAAGARWAVAAAAGVRRVTVATGWRG